VGDGSEDGERSAARPPRPRALAAGTVLVLLGLLAWALSGFAGGRENHSYDANGRPPATVHVTAGHTYWLAVPGGVKRLNSAGVVPSALRCTSTGTGQATVKLAVTAVVSSGSLDTKFVNRIASFVADATGRVHVDCAGVGTPYVENADDSGFDWSGLLLVLTVALLVVGVPLLLSGLRRTPRPALPAAREPVGAGEQHEVQ
jgi:hypothetical protein